MTEGEKYAVGGYGPKIVYFVGLHDQLVNRVNAHNRCQDGCSLKESQYLELKSDLSYLAIREAIPRLNRPNNQLT
jgi:hypothetical protein